MGHDSAEFVSDWRLQHSQALTNTQLAVAQLSSVAQRNVLEQESASGVEGNGLPAMIGLAKGKLLEPIDDESHSGFEFHPNTVWDSTVNVGRGLSFGVSDWIANEISPGSSSTVPDNAIQQDVGKGAIVATGAVAAAAIVAPGVMATDLGSASEVAGSFVKAAAATAPSTAGASDVVAATINIARDTEPGMVMDYLRAVTEVYGMRVATMAQAQGLIEEYPYLAEKFITTYRGISGAP